MNPLVKEINQELESLGRELSNFKSLVSYLDDAKNLITEANDKLEKTDKAYLEKIDRVAKINNDLKKIQLSYEAFLAKIDAVDFPEHFDKIQSSFLSIDSHLKEFKESSLSEMKAASKLIADSKISERFEDFSKLIDDLKLDNDKFKKKLSEKMADVHNLVEGLNFTIRIDKLDASIAGVLTTIQAIQNSIDKSERYIIDKVESYSKSQTEALLGLQEALGASVNRLDDEIEASKRSNRIFHIVTWILLVGLGVMMVIAK